MTMTKALLPLAFTIIIALLSFIGASIHQNNNRLFDFIESNTKEHSDIKQVVKTQIDWTGTVYKYEIAPNTKRSKKNESRIVIIENKIK